MPADITNQALITVLRILVAVAVFFGCVASARGAGLIAAAEAVFGVFVMVVMSCFRVLGCHGGVAVRVVAGEGFWAGSGGGYWGSGEGGGECERVCRVCCRRL